MVGTTMGTRRQKSAKEMVRLNLGSGSNLLTGFVNVDLYHEQKSNGIVFKKGDIRHLPFDSEIADYVLCDNVLEHLPMADIPLALFEIRRVMKPGARAVIMVPDFSFIAKQFLENAAGRFNAMVYRWCAETAYGIQTHEGEYHHTPFCPEYLNFQLHMAGFSNFEMIMFPAASPLPKSSQYPGINPSNEPSYFRNDNILVDIRK